MINEDKTRIQITLTKDVCSNMDELCGVMGLTRSQFIASTIGEKLVAYSMMRESLPKLGLDLLDKQKA